MERCFDLGSNVCIDRYTPCGGRCWHESNNRLCGNNLCLSSFQTMVKASADPLNRRDSRKRYFFLSLSSGPPCLQRHMLRLQRSLWRSLPKQGLLHVLLWWPVLPLLGQLWRRCAVRRRIGRICHLPGLATKSFGNLPLGQFSDPSCGRILSFYFVHSVAVPWFLLHPWMGAVTHFTAVTAHP